MTEDEGRQDGGAAESPRPGRDDPKRVQQREDSLRDRALVDKARGGDARAFDQLYRLYHTRAYNIALRVTRNPESALDVVQEAFIKVFKNLETFEGGSSFYTWLYRIVMNLAIDKVRAEARDQRHVAFDERQAQDESLLTGGSPDRAASPLHRVLRTELSGRIRAAVAELPEYHQRAIVLREVDGLSYEEIAEIMDCPKGTVMSRLFHARKKLQEQLSPYLAGDLEIDD